MSIYAKAAVILFAAAIGALLGSWARAPEVKALRSTVDAQNKEIGSLDAEVAAARSALDAAQEQAAKRVETVERVVENVRHEAPTVVERIKEVVSYVPTSNDACGAAGELLDWYHARAVRLRDAGAISPAGAGGADAAVPAGGPDPTAGADSPRGDAADGADGREDPGADDRPRFAAGRGPGEPGDSGRMRAVGEAAGWL